MCVWGGGGGEGGGEEVVCKTIVLFTGVTAVVYIEHDCSKTTIVLTPRNRKLQQQIENPTHIIIHTHVHVPAVNLLKQMTKMH